LGLVLLTLSLALLGCENSIDTPVEMDTPIEIGGSCKCEPGGRCECLPTNGCECGSTEQSPEITGFTFIQANPLRSAYAVNEKTVGRFTNPVGGTAPYTYVLVTGNGSNDVDNESFIVFNDTLKIQSDCLIAGMYSIYLRVTDSKGVSYSQGITVTIVPNPVVLDQETRNVQGVNFMMRYVPSGAFIKPDMMYGDMEGQGIEVEISSGFWMAETEVTQELYQAVIGSNPSVYKDNPAPGERQNQRPVGNVTYYEAVLFCNYLSIMSGREPVYHIWGVPEWDTYLKWAISNKSNAAVSNIFADEKANGYRLPTFDEWAWAAMGANIQNPGQVNVNGANKYYSGGPVGSSVGLEEYVWIHVYPDVWTIHEVGRKRSNELGIFDMTGNSNEWVWGSYSASSSGYSRIYNVNVGGSIKNPNERVSTNGIRIVSNQ
jgi:formylglycine-generating enzyme required for sulfatase activity